MEVSVYFKWKPLQYVTGRKWQIKSQQPWTYMWMALYMIQCIPRNMHTVHNLLIFFAARYFTISCSIHHWHRAIIWLPLCHWSNPEGYRQMHHINPEMSDKISTANGTKTKPCPCSMEYTVHHFPAITIPLFLLTSDPLCLLWYEGCMLGGCYAIQDYSYIRIHLHWSRLLLNSID